MCRSTPTVMSSVATKRQPRRRRAAIWCFTEERGEGRKIEGGGKKWVVDWVIGGERENERRAEEGAKEGGSEPDGFHCHFKVLDDDKSRPTDGRPSE